jgi:hypothetical protein
MSQNYHVIIIKIKYKPTTYRKTNIQKIYLRIGNNKFNSLQVHFISISMLNLY